MRSAPGTFVAPGAPGDEVDEASSAFSAVGFGEAPGRDGVLVTAADSEPASTGMLPSISGVPPGVLGEGATGSDGSKGAGEPSLVLS